MTVRWAPCLDKPVLAQEGGGGGYFNVHMGSRHSEMRLDPSKLLIPRGGHRPSVNVTTAVRFAPQAWLQESHEASLPLAMLLCLDSPPPDFQSGGILMWELLHGTHTVCSVEGPTANGTSKLLCNPKSRSCCLKLQSGSIKWHVKTNVLLAAKDVRSSCESSTSDKQKV